MKVAYLSSFLENSGYSHAATEYCLALDTVGIDVVTRDIPMMPPKGVVHPKIQEMFKKNLDNVDVVIQHNLPSQFSYKGGVKNVGMFAYETDSFPNTTWKYHLELMDQNIVFCHSQLEAVGQECNVGTYKNTAVIPHALDTDKFIKEQGTINFGLPLNTVKFYTIADWGKRKDFAALFLGYFTAFSADDNVVLVVKTTGRHQAVKDMIEDIKTGCKRFANNNRYPKVVLMTDWMTEDEISAIHNSCNVFVSTSHGEAFCIPAVEARGFGNFTLVPNHTAFKDYLPAQTMIECVKSPVFGVTNSPEDLYTSNERWYNVMTDDLVLKMRYVYENFERFNSPEVKRQRKEYVIDQFSRENVGRQLVEVLCS